MAKYINVETAENSLRQYAEQKHANGEIELANGILKAVCKLKTLPAADVKEAVRGKWIDPYINKYGHPCHVCSVCGFKASQQDKNFCPHCNADMGVE